MPNSAVRRTPGSTWSTSGAARRVSPQARARGGRTAVAAGSSAAALVLTGIIGASPAVAAQPDPALGTAKSFAVLAGSTVTNTGPSLIAGNLGVSPGTAVTGFPPGLVINGVQNAANAVARGAQADLAGAWVDAAGRGPATAVAADIGGRTLKPGVYSHASGMFLTGTVTLDAQNDPKAVFIFQAGSTLITASSSRVRLLNGAQPCNVYWQVGSSATLGTNTDFVGTVMALTSVSLKTGADVEGRVLARNGAVTLDTNTIRLPRCNESPIPGVTSGTPGGGGAKVDTPTGGTGRTGGTGGTGGGNSTGGGDSTGGRGDSTRGGSGSGGSGSGGSGSGGSGAGSSGGDSPGDDTKGPRIPPGHPQTGRGGTS